MGKTIRQWCGFQVSKVAPPYTVFVGDSLTEWGGKFGHWRNVNLGLSGLLTVQIAKRLETAKLYRPQRIIVMAGTNDAIEDMVVMRRLESIWREILSDRRVMAVLLPPTRLRDVNARIDAINEIIQAAAKEREAKLLKLPDLIDEDGLLRSTCTEDGIHLNSAGYAVWNKALFNLPKA